MSTSVDDSGTQRHLLDDSVLDDAVCTSSDGSLPGSGLLISVCCMQYSKLATHILIRGYHTAVFISTRISRSNVDYQPEAIAEG